MEHLKTSDPVAFETTQSMWCQSGALAGKVILVVDDSPEMTTLVADIFTAAGATVKQANCGSEAVLQIGGGEFDVLILDLSMPEISGYMILRFLKRSHPEFLARTIVMTATSPQDGQALAEVEKYQVASLFKPFAIARLVGTACRLVAPGKSTSVAGVPQLTRH